MYPGRTSARRYGKPQLFEASLIFLQISIKFPQKFHIRFASVSKIIVINYSHGFNKIFSLTFTITLIRHTIFLKFYPKILFCFDTVSQNFFKNLTKITLHYFYKTYNIFDKFNGMSRTFSISSLMFLLKLALHCENLRNVPQVFHPQWETIDSRLAICSQLVYEQSQNFVYRHKFAILSTSVY